jgi:tripartite-type tricarboxylate transporter receptor subunit TctC
VVLPQTTFFLVRRGAPADRLAKLSDVMTSVAALPEVGKACLDTGGEVVTARGAALQRHADDEIQRWSSAAARAKFAPSE